VRGHETARRPGRYVTAKAIERAAEAIGIQIAERDQQEIGRAKQLVLPVGFETGTFYARAIENDPACSGLAAVPPLSSLCVAAASIGGSRINWEQDRVA
jgi:hypothetical protein